MSGAGPQRQGAWQGRNLGQPTRRVRHSRQTARPRRLFPKSPGKARVPTIFPFVPPGLARSGEPRLFGGRGYPCHSPRPWCGCGGGGGDRREGGEGQRPLSRRGRGGGDPNTRRAGRALPSALECTARQELSVAIQSSTTDQRVWHRMVGHTRTA
jgi:hypothetical protein